MFDFLKQRKDRPHSRPFPVGEGTGNAESPSPSAVDRSSCVGEAARSELAGK